MDSHYPGPMQKLGSTGSSPPQQGRLPCQQLARRLKSCPKANTTFLSRALSCLEVAQGLGNLLGLIFWLKAAQVIPNS